MADEVDLANDIGACSLEAAVRAAARVPFVTGVAGECEGCDEVSPRLVGGRCAPCRDRRRSRP